MFKIISCDTPFAHSFYEDIIKLGIYELPAENQIEYIQSYAFGISSSVISNILDCQDEDYDWNDIYNTHFFAINAIISNASLSEKKEILSLFDKTEIENIHLKEFHKKLTIDVHITEFNPTKVALDTIDDNSDFYKDFKTRYKNNTLDENNSFISNMVELELYKPFSTRFHLNSLLSEYLQVLTYESLALHGREYLNPETDENDHIELNSLNDIIIETFDTYRKVNAPSLEESLEAILPPVKK
jgi:hypothetical protein